MESHLLSGPDNSFDRARLALGEPTCETTLTGKSFHPTLRKSLHPVAWISGMKKRIIVQSTGLFPKPDLVAKEKTMANATLSQILAFRIDKVILSSSKGKIKRGGNSAD
ncbi:hypothetical protein CLAIMM_05790 [Cladophialophora immunda]|nr:hypothetical protein CLAIMM_05790 [Cladophialophora immunda]